MREIPVVDLQDAVGPRQAAFVHTLDGALRNFGFVRVRGHDVTPERVRPAFDAARAFFALPTEAKARYHRPALAGERGYTPFGGEHAKNATVPDLKEFWHTGRELDPDHPLSRLYPRNLWPDDVPRFRDAMLDLYGALERCSEVLLEAVALGIDQPEDTFTRLTQNGNTVLRALHYPPIASDDPLAQQGAIRAAAHEDINFITLLVTSTSPGLEILDRDGAWWAVNAAPGEIVVDAGDMLSRVTNGVIPSTTHRVVNPDSDASARLSMPFFVHPRPDVVLRVLEPFRRPPYPPPAPDITGRAFLDERLAQIGFRRSPGMG